MKLLTERNIVILFGTFAVAFFILAVVGGVNYYSPVPYWDMWDGYINFYLSVQNNDLNAWWLQHNEHRIVLTKVLFWLDHYFFNGSSIFLIITNYMLAGLSFLILYYALKEKLPNDSQRNTRYILGSIIFCLVFSWMQLENFTWGFQSQFYLSYIMPLGAFLLLYKSHISHDKRYYYLSCIVGVAASVNMGNTILTLPLMFILSLLFGMNKRQVTILLLLSIMMPTIYFYNYTSPGHHGPISHELIHNPIHLFQYILFYLGSPVFFTKIKSSVISQGMGLFLILSCLYFSWATIKSLKTRLLDLSLLTFMFYVGASALAVAGSRLMFGFESAVSSRYTTPVLMSWCVLLILYTPLIEKIISKHFYRILILFIVPLLLFSKQWTVFDWQTHKNFERKIAMLALELKIKDEPQINMIYPHTDRLLNISEKAAEKNISYFNDPLIKNASALIGTKFNSPCQGYVDVVENISTDSYYVKVNGWLFNLNERKPPQVIYFLDDKNIVVGYAFTGMPRSDLTSAIDEKAALAGFKGYVLKDKINKPLTLQGINPSCEIPLRKPFE